MISGEEFLKKIGEAFPSVVNHYRYPFVVLEIEDPAFASKDDEGREAELAHKSGIEPAELRGTLDRLFIRTQLRAPNERVQPIENTGQFWLRYLTSSQPSAGDAADPRTIHFWGYKGGQARSTVLAFLASVLASGGWRVLVVDADAEAPSLDILFRAVVTNPEASLVGLRGGLDLRPLRVASGSQGHADLIAFRPSDSRYDLDAAALAMEQSLAPGLLASLAARVSQFAAGSYDVLLIDHRTGISPTVLPWVTTLPGPVVVCAKLDEQWRPAQGHVRAIWGIAGEDPGVVLSFKTDSDPLSRYRSRVKVQAEALLDDLATATSRAAGDSTEELTGDQISDHWVVWPFDSAFVDGPIPHVRAVGGQALEAVSELRRLLSLGAAGPEGHVAELHRSGARDEGDLIQTSALRALSSSNNVLFVLGRKGTGKTRLVRALDELGVGQPLLVADDFKKAKGIRANWPELKSITSELRDEPMRFWWVLVTAALGMSTTDRSELQARAQRLSSVPLTTLVQRARSYAKPLTAPRVYLIDGLETAFGQGQILNYISALVQFVSSIDGDELFRAVVRPQVFLRTDLAVKGYENFEQLSQGRTLELEWDAQGILNFVLSRVAALPWFREKFGPAVTRIEAHSSRIRSGAVEIEEAEELLLSIFPARLRRLNLKMTTFMRTYFSDDPSGLRSFYPRIYDEFLTFIASPRRALKGQEDVEGKGPRRRVSQQLIYAAHEHATNQFLQQVRSELRYIIALQDDELDQLLGSLRGTTTPFRLEERIRLLATKTKIPGQKVRAAFDQMLNLGMFEVRDGYPGQWRVGRLFKSSLGMLYARGDKSPDRA
jgi:hypothetical protein